MPDRIVRAEILTSEPVSSLSWAAEVFYRRLFSVVDDYGRYDGRPSLLRAHLYPMKLDRVSESDVGKWLTECVNAGLVRQYTVSGRPYVEVLKFGQRVRAEKSKWPDPPTSADSCQQPLTDAPVFVFDDVGVSVDVTPKPPAGAELLFELFWKAYPRKVGKDAARRAFDKRKPTRQLLDQMLSSLTRQCESEQWKKNGGQFIPHPSTWLNEGRWQDEQGEGGSAVSAPWWDTRSGIEGMGEKVGIGRWDEMRGHWPSYQRAVFKKAHELGHEVPEGVEA